MAGLRTLCISFMKFWRVWVPTATLVGLVSYTYGRFERQIDWFLVQPATIGWAAAIGSTLAAVAAVTAAFVPTIIQRKRDKEIGAVDAASTSNTIGMAMLDMGEATAARKIRDQERTVLFYLDECLEKINSIPIRSVMNYSIDLAQHLLTAKNQLIILRRGFGNDHVWKKASTSVNHHLNQYNQKLRKAEAVVGQLISAEIAAAQQNTKAK